MDAEFLSKMIITDVCSATTMYTEKGTKAIRKSRSRWAVVIKYEGETIYVSNGREYLSDKNNIVILPKGCNYEWMCTKSGRFSIIEFQCDTEYSEVVSFEVSNSDKILKIFKETEYKKTLDKPLCVIECIRDIYSLVLRLTDEVQKSYVPSSKREKILPAVEYIAKNYHRKISNDELAAMTKLSTVYFRKLFFEQFGISPIAYIHNLRITKAKEMLRSDYGSITDIASSLGYSNIYDFSRDFKNHTGVSPSNY